MSAKLTMTRRELKTENVAQISNLPYRRFLVGMVSEIRDAFELSSACGLETRDTAGWKPALQRILVVNPFRSYEIFRRT